ncbi:hypothetical protein ASF24_11560 [Methylobacterium sp. Leaf86]|uniref:DUF308 domain-containing protein n=1 Tax=Methylobacterium sp. Leaf86 TaxID=1736242 RepID=UPI0006FFBA01|nr:DUF308 domain-containing protein [Methylobacterium sp. Leaf86]KQO60095.1 hypothetical protein ASF24_11560 [Methylobacterium sp. Leaf86]
MPVPASTQWLTSYYFVRAGVAAAWVAAAVTVGRSVSPVAAVLLVAYPAWDAGANLVDAQRSGGWRANPSQIVNAAISTVTALAVAVSLGLGPHAILAVFGCWAILSGMSQLATGIRRWNGGAQWAMVLSGAQSSLAGLFFLAKANDVATPGIMDVVPYAGFGAFYFLVSAVWLAVARARQASVEGTA